MLKENMIVDCAYASPEYPNNIIVNVDGEYYLLPTLGRTSNDLSQFKKVPSDVIKVKKSLVEIPNYRYVAQELTKKSGFDVIVGRSISEKEFAEIKESLKLGEDDISEPFVEKRGAVYGEENTKRFTCIQIKTSQREALQLEKQLKKKGIEAGCVNAGIVNIRIQK